MNKFYYEQATKQKIIARCILEPDNDEWTLMYKIMRKLDEMIIGLGGRYNMEEYAILNNEKIERGI